MATAMGEGEGDPTLSLPVAATRIMDTARLPTRARNHSPTGAGIVGAGLPVASYVLLVRDYDEPLGPATLMIDAERWGSRKLGLLGGKVDANDASERLIRRAGMHGYRPVRSSRKRP